MEKDMDMVRANVPMEKDMDTVRANVLMEKDMVMARENVVMVMAGARKPATKVLMRARTVEGPTGNVMARVRAVRMVDVGERNL